MTKSGEPCLHSSPGKTHHKVKANIGPRRRMQQRTYPFVSVILSPGSKIGHTPRKNPSPSGAGNLPHQRISRLAQDACNYLHKPFAAKKDYSTTSHKLQVFFGVFAKFFYGFSTFCRNLPVMHQLPCFWQKQGRIWCNTTGFCVQAENLWAGTAEIPSAGTDPSPHHAPRPCRSRPPYNIYNKVGSCNSNKTRHRVFNVFRTPSPWQP